MIETRQNKLETLHKERISIRTQIHEIHRVLQDSPNEAQKFDLKDKATKMSPSALAVALIVGVLLV